MKKALGLVVSLALLALIWWQIDLGSIASAMRTANPWWLGAGLLTIVPLTLVTAARFGMLSRTPISFRILPTHSAHFG